MNSSNTEIFILDINKNLQIQTLKDTVLISVF